jgi:23S rRNA (adenine1618-N6)-methyltransferase
VPGRADHVHYAADLLAASNDGVVPRGDGVRVLDVGVGANCIYPIVGRAEYGWRFVGSDTDPKALESAQRIVDANPSLAQGVKIRRQTAPAILKHLLTPEERFDLTLCNPPFNASAAQAEAGASRKRRNLGIERPEKNFGGQSNELWTPGGEAAFLTRLIEESAGVGGQVAWFSALVSKAQTLDSIERALGRAKAADSCLIDVEHGNKKSRIVAWTFLDAEAMAAWRAERWRR